MIDINHTHPAVNASITHFSPRRTNTNPHVAILEAHAAQMREGSKLAVWCACAEGDVYFASTPATARRALKRAEGKQAATVARPGESDPAAREWELNEARDAAEHARRQVAVALVMENLVRGLGYRPAAVVLPPRRGNERGSASGAAIPVPAVVTNHPTVRAP